MLPRYNELNYYVVLNKATDQYVAEHPGIYGYGELPVPNIRMAVGTDLDDAIKHFNLWFDSIASIITTIEGYDEEYRSEEYLKELRSVDLILVHIKEKREFRRSQVIV